MRLTDNQRGAALMIACMTAFTLNDACMKALGAELPLFQAIFLRGVLSSVALYGLARFHGGLSLPVGAKDRWLVALRTGCEVGAAFFFISALFNMPIANVTAILQALPLTVTLAGAVFLREPVGWRRWLAILVGFVGVLLIVRPGTDGFTLYSVYALLAVVCVTVRDLAARRMSAGVSSTTAAFFAAFGVTVLGAVGSPWTDWVAVSAGRVGLLILATVFLVVAILTSVMTMRVGDLAVVTPFRYTSLLVALVLGLVVFGEWPDAITLLGASIIIAMGLFTIWREQQAKA
ncbi:MAG: drug/metabolite transporter (DMT)-like permease [Dinoroseobacter sp.]|jgi:drug/metabolite transporter (DMT)-like permease